MRSQILHISKLLGVFLLPTKVYPKDLLYDTYIYHIQLLLNCRVLALGPTCVWTGLACPVYFDILWSERFYKKNILILTPFDPNKAPYFPHHDFSVVIRYHNLLQLAKLLPSDPILKCPSMPVNPHQ